MDMTQCEEQETWQCSICGGGTPAARQPSRGRWVEPDLRQERDRDLTPSPHVMPGDREQLDQAPATQRALRHRPPTRGQGRTWATDNYRLTITAAATEDRD